MKWEYKAAYNAFKRCRQRQEWKSQKAAALAYNVEIALWCCAHNPGPKVREWLIQAMDNLEQELR